MKQYINQNDKTIKIEVFYNKGGVNYYNGKTEKRGYYLLAVPVEISGGTMCNVQKYQIEKITAFTGYRFLIHEASRKSEKQYNEALKISETEIKNILTYFN